MVLFVFIKLISVPTASAKETFGYRAVCVCVCVCIWQCPFEDRQYRPESVIDRKSPANGKAPSAELRPPAMVGPGPPARPPPPAELVVPRPDPRNFPGYGYYYPKKIYQLPGSQPTSPAGYPPMNSARSYYYWSTTSFWSRDVADNHGRNLPKKI